jgi:hypothetical protein
MSATPMRKAKDGKSKVSAIGVVIAWLEQSSAGMS